MTHSEKLLLAVCQNPEDWHLRLVLADAYEEENNTMSAECQRWMAKHRKRASSIFPNDKATIWFDASRVVSKHDPGSNLPEILFNALRGKESEEDTMVMFDSIEESEKVVMRAFPLAVARGWDLTDPVREE